MFARIEHYNHSDNKNKYNMKRHSSLKYYSMFFLRRRTLLLKIVVVLAALWIIVALIVTDDGTTNVILPNINHYDKIVNPYKVIKQSTEHVRVGSNFSNGIGVLTTPESVNAPGEFGKPVILSKNISEEIQQSIKEGWKKNSFNQYVSDMISVRRKLPDFRDEWCKQPGRYLEQLPQTSVVICFHNEAWSVLLRTVYSVLDRSPEHLIKEIILVDDFSDMSHLKQKLDDYMSSLPKVRIIRASRREGLTRARLLGGRHATAPVLTYLDSHCECTEGWLEPLLDRIARNETTVVCPTIDIINGHTLEYQSRSSDTMNVGGFDWNLQFTWHSAPARERSRHKNIAEPLWSPTMAGGLFAIDKSFFERLGTYDSGFDIWGGENLELSFKIWMCGGTLEIVPCSHVGHIFREIIPYKWIPGVDVVKRNSVRLAEVWLDDYAKYYYQRFGYKKGDFGDISSRKALREQLGCKSFEWYLKNVYPERTIPESVAYGEIRNMGFPDICLDSPTMDSTQYKPIGLYSCHHQGGNQYWIYTKNGEIRRDDTCLDYYGDDVVLYPCHEDKGNQLWFYDHETKHLKHVIKEKCMAISKNKDKVVMEMCDPSEARQMWKMENYDTDKQQL